MSFRPETVAAIAAARAAGALSARRTNAETIIDKGELDIATGTDLAAEDAIRSELGRSFPEYVVVGEERGGDAPARDATYWLVDPLCGTQTFACRIPAFCSNIALVERGRVTCSAVFDGASGDVYAAELGQGAFVARGSDWQRLAARDGTVMAFELAGTPVPASTARGAGALFGALLAAGRWHLRSLGTTLPFARVAFGDFAGFFLVGAVSSPLHTAAGCLLAEEAGAVVSDTRGERWDLSTNAFVVAATPKLHQELVAFYRAAFADTRAFQSGAVAP